MTVTFSIVTTRMSAFTKILVFSLISGRISFHKILKGRDVINEKQLFELLQSSYIDLALKFELIAPPSLAKILWYAELRKQRIIVEYDEYSLCGS